MRNLLLSSLLFSLIFSCSPKLYKDLKNDSERTEKLAPIFNEQVSSYLYKAKIDILTHYLSGLLFIKPMGKDTFRLVFTNELGVKFFDVEYFPNGSKVHYAMEKLDRKVVMNTLEKDMKMFLMTDVTLQEGERLTDENKEKKIFKFKEKKDFYYYFLNRENQITRIENTSKSKVKIEVDLKDYNNGIPYFINIKHNSFKFNIELNYLER